MSRPVDTPDWAAPATAQQVLLWSGSVSAWPAPLDVSLWASLIIKLSAPDPAGLYSTLFRFLTAGGIQVDQGLLSANTSWLSGCAWWLPVTAQSIDLAQGMASTQQAAIFGSNTPAPGKRMLGDFLPARGFIATIANGTPAGTFTRLTGSPVDGSATFADLSGFNGDCDFIARVFTTGGAAQWDFLPEILNYDGTFSRYIYQSLTAVGTAAFVKAHPRAFVRWNVRNTTILTAQAQVELDIIPKALA